MTDVSKTACPCSCRHSSRNGRTYLTFIQRRGHLGLHQGLLEAIDEFRQKAADLRMVIIDTHAMVRPPKKGNQGSYTADYEGGPLFVNVSDGASDDDARG